MHFDSITVPLLCSTLVVLHPQQRTSLFIPFDVFSIYLRGTVHVNGDINKSLLNGNKPDYSFGDFCRVLKASVTVIAALGAHVRSSWKCFDSQCKDSILSGDSVTSGHLNIKVLTRWSAAFCGNKIWMNAWNRTIYSSIVCVSFSPYARGEVIQCHFLTGINAGQRRSCSPTK